MMEKYEDYWNELDELRTESSSQNNNNDYLEEEFSSGHFREGDQEADWLRDVGLSNLTETFRSGREIADTELNASISYLSSRQADAVKRRVWTLNQTIRNGRGQGQRARQRKPDIRDVFRDAENSSTGTRSRSATPDSLDDHTPDPTDPDEWPTHSNNNQVPEAPDTTTLLDANATSTMLLPNAAVAVLRKQHDEEQLLMLHSQHFNASNASNARATSDMFRKPGGVHGVVGQKQRMQRMDVASDSEVARSLSFMGAKIWGLGRRQMLPDDKEYQHYAKYCIVEELPILLQHCDYVINVLPSTEDTKGLLNGDMFQNCIGKKTIFINIGRGSIINESDLITALANKWLAGAILDVFENEPLAKESELWNLEQVFITPHVAGVSRSKDVAEQFVENLNLYENGLSIPTELQHGKKY